MASVLTTTVLQTVTKTAAASASPSASTRARPQGGVIDGENPSVYDPKNPIVLFIIQASIIIIFCRLLHYPLSKIRQPRVIAEVIGGILLGPSVFGRIHGFSDAIFPPASIPNLNLVANLGLVFFLFLVGLEVDVRFLASNWRVASAVGIGSMALPFGLGCAIAWGLYNEFPAGQPISFGVFMLFVGVAMAITAFPVLCRILTELKLLSTPVGVIVLSAGVGNDVTGWILLALCVALVNAGSGLTALWVLLTSAGYILFLVFAIRPAFMWILKRTRSVQDGPSQSIIALTLLLVLASSFFTGVIGIHPIFGAFVVGLICPHEGGFAIKVTEKVEDLIGALFLPLYFALSGLNTNLGLLNSGIVWAYVVGILAVAFFGKVIGATLSARVAGCVWRESFAIGALMSCKGLVELIVLNIGLQARILTVQTFTMFVVMALATTFATTPLTHWLYPPTYQRKLAAWKRGEIDWDTGKPIISPPGTSVASVQDEKLETSNIRKMLVYLSIDNMSSTIAFLSILCPPRVTESHLHPTKVQSKHGDPDTFNEEPSKPKRAIAAHGIHLIGLTERTSSVMQVSEIDEHAQNDPVVNTFQTFGQLYKVDVSGEVDVAPNDSFANTLTHRATDYGSDFLLLPWGQMGALRDADLSRSAMGVTDGDYASFINRTLKTAPCNAAVFVNLSTNKPREPQSPLLARTKSVQSLNVRDPPKLTAPSLGVGTRHIFTPIFGGPDDLLAIGLTLQMVEQGCTATIARYNLPNGHEEPNSTTEYNNPNTSTTTSDPVHTTPGTSSTATKLLAKFRASPTPASKDHDLFTSLRSSLPSSTRDRIVFETIELDDLKANVPSAAAERAANELNKLPKGVGGMVVLGRNWKLKGLERREGGSDVEKCLGVVGMEVLKAGLKGGMLVVKAS